MKTIRPQKGTTIWDVTRASNVSIATVSHVINNGPRAVRPATRDRVLEAIKRLNYHPNAMARGLIRRQMNTIGVISGVFTARELMGNPYASGILQGVLNGASASGNDVLLFIEDWVDLETSGAVYRDRRADGIIAIAPTVNSDMISGLISLELAVVAVSADCVSLGVPIVDVDNERGGRVAAEHLIALGHKRIAHLAGNPDLVSARKRLSGFLGAMERGGVEIRNEYIIHTFYSGINAYEDAMQLLRLPEPPTAIFCGNDTIMLKVLFAARDLGISVPEQLSIVGFDDIPALEHVRPRMTTVRHPVAAIGQLATTLLVERLSSGVVEAKTHLIPPVLVVRSSTARPYGA